MANAEHFVRVHKYYCHSCECYFEEPAGPRKGHWFNTSSGYRDSDGDTFFEGDTKLLVGTRSWACHNEDSHCLLDEGDWTMIECSGFRCTSCGQEYTYDNDHCSAHQFGTGADGRKGAEHAANHCCTAGRNAPSTSGDLAAMAQPKTGAQKVTVIEF
jgi:hypothetical protein